MTAPLRQRDRSSWGRTAIRRMIGTLRHVNEELLHAHEAMARPVGAPQPRPHVDTAGTGASVQVDRHLSEHDGTTLLSHNTVYQSVADP